MPVRQKQQAGDRDQPCAKGMQVSQQQWVELAQPAKRQQHGAEQRKLKKQQRQQVDEHPVDADLQRADRRPAKPERLRKPVAPALREQRSPGLVDGIPTKLRQTEHHREQFGDDARQRAGQPRQISPVHLEDIDFRHLAGSAAAHAEASGFVAFACGAVAQMLAQQVFGDRDATVARRSDVWGLATSLPRLRRGTRRLPFAALEIGASGLQEGLGR